MYAIKDFRICPADRHLVEIDRPTDAFSDLGPGLASVDALDDTYIAARDRMTAGPVSSVFSRVGREPHEVVAAVSQKLGSLVVEIYTPQSMVGCHQDFGGILLRRQTVDVRGCQNFAQRLKLLS